MILPATAQILLHSSVLIWTAYYLIVKPSVVLNSSIVDIFGQALQLVITLPKLSLMPASFLRVSFR
jgi:hypothetical protein